MRDRCLNPRCDLYPNYGGRGITICAAWASFERFYADMGPRPSADHSLDRKDNDGPYAPGNCRWATRGVQLRNTRRAVLVTHEGRTLTVTDWAAELGIHATTLAYRLKRWPLALALART